MRRVCRRLLWLALGIGLHVCGLGLLQAAQGKLAQSESAFSDGARAAIEALPPDPPLALKSARLPKTTATTQKRTNAEGAKTSYQLNARLDAKTHTIFGSGRIHFNNQSQRAVSELYFHLYLNAFKNDASLFLRSPFGAGRSGGRAVDYGYIDVKRLSAPRFGSGNLWEAARKANPNDPDETDLRVPLPAPVAPGETLELQIEFEAKLPRIVERTGYVDGYHFVAQWFPKLAKLEESGTFAHFPFHPQAEFYADFGDYDVSVDVPNSMCVGATGRRIETREHQGRRIERFKAESVHDFAWTAWDGFAIKEAQIAGIEVEILYPEHEPRVATRTLQTLRAALPHFNRQYGRYPYPTLTVVHPPEVGTNSGGMEYPTLITTGAPWYAPMLGVRALEVVTIHELGHQWFYGLVATNERRFPFLDEGLNSYAEGLALEELYGTTSYTHLLGFELAAISVQRALAAAHALDDVVAQPAPEFSSFGLMGALVYSRTATILETIARVYGRSKLSAALGHYTRRYRYAHPTPEDFFSVMKEHLGPDAMQNLRAALHERGWVDYVAGDLRSAPVRTAAGLFDRPHGREKVETSTENDGQWQSRLLVYRHGTLTFPVEVELILEDGTRFRRWLHGPEPVMTISYQGEQPLVGAIIDPDQHILLDQNLLNNALLREKTSASRTLERGMYLAQVLLSFLGP